MRRAALFKRGSARQGYGRLFVPGLDYRTGEKDLNGGKVAGDEVLAFADDGSGRQNVAMLLQIPARLSAERRCLLAIPVAGSASLYRDIVDFGYWGLRRGCAVVYTGKGHGNGFHLLAPTQSTFSTAAKCRQRQGPLPGRSRRRRSTRVPRALAASPRS